MSDEDLMGPDDLDEAKETMCVAGCCGPDGGHEHDPATCQHPCCPGWDGPDCCDECMDGHHADCTDVEDGSCCCPPGGDRHYFASTAGDE